MRKRQAMKLLDTIFLEYGQTAGRMRFEASFAKSSFSEAHKKAIQWLRKCKRTPKAHDDLPYTFMGVSAMARDLKGGTGKFPIGQAYVEDEARVRAFVQHLNRQYQWSLVGTFEAYERFVKDLYSALGYLDNNSWECKDLGGISPADVKNQKLAWFKDQTRGSVARNNCDNIFSRFRKAFPNIGTIEQASDILIPCKTAELFRHWIVHSHATIGSLDLFWESLSRKTGEQLRFHKGAAKKRRGIFRRYLKRQTGCGSYMIWLVQDSALCNPTYAFIEGKLDHLTVALSSHACLLYSEVINYFGHKPYWGR